MRRVTTLVPWILTTALVATAVPDPSEARLASNRLASNRLASNRLASNRLASNALATQGLQAHDAAAELLATPEGREVFGYIVSCALPPDVTITATVDDVPYEFPGSLGLAPRWLEKKLNKKGQRWVSACLLARVNRFETAEAVSLRGDHEGLGVSLDEAEIYSVQEGAFYGQLFDDDGDIQWFACRGEGQASGEFGGLGLRDCAEPDPADPTHTICGLTYAGDCADYTPAFPSDYACKTFDAATTSYERCHDRPGPGRWSGAKKFKQVITVYVSP